MGKNNIQLREEKGTTIQHWGLRKLSVGVASVLLGTTAYLGMGSGVVVHADTIPSNNNADVVADSKGAMSQGLYQSDDLQTTKEQASANDVGTVQAVDQNVNRAVTNSKNSSNNQAVQLDYQSSKQSVSGLQEANPYVVLAANLSTNYSSNAQLENINLTGWSANYKDLSADKTITIDTSQANTRIGFDGKFRLSADQLNKAGSIKLFSIVQTSDTNAYNSISLENNDSAFVLDGKTLGHYHLSIDERTADAKDFNPKFKRLTLSLVIDQPLGNASGSRELNVNVPWIGTMSWSAPYAFRGNYTYSNNVLSVQGQGLYGSYRKDYHIRYYKSPNSQSVINGQSDRDSYIHLLPQSGVTSSGKMSLVLDAKYIGWTDPHWVSQFLNNHGTGPAINLNQYVEHAARYSVDGQSLIINASDQPAAVAHFGNMPAFNSAGQIYGDHYVDAQTIGVELGKESSITIFPPNTSMLTMKNSGKLGYLISQQDDGSVICYVKIPLSDFCLQDSQKQSVINSIIYTSQRLNKDANNDDQALQIANQWVSKWVNGSLKGVPLNVSEGGPIVRLTSPFSHTTIHSQQLNINTGQPITGQDFTTTNNINDAKANGQLEIRVHYINDKTGAEIAQTKDFVAWPSEAKAVTADIPEIDHYSVVKNLDGQTTLHLTDGTIKTLGGSIISDGTGLNYGSLSSNNGVKNYYVVYHQPEAAQQTIIVKYVDDDDNGYVLQTDTVKGPAGSSSTYTTAKELGILRAQHYVLSSDETNGKPLVFDTDNSKDRVYTVHVKHDTEEEAITSMTVNGKIFYANTPGDLVKVPSDQMPLPQNILPINYSGIDGLGFSISRDLVTDRWSIDHVVSSFHCGLLNQVKGFRLLPVISSMPLIDRVQHFWGSSWQMAETDLFRLAGSGDSGSESVLGADIKVDLAKDDDSSFIGPSVTATVTINFHYQYMPAAESAKITYVDDTTGNTLKTEEIAADYDTYVGMNTPGGPDVTRAANGYGSKIQFKTDPAAQIKLYQDQGYQLVSNNFTEGATFKDGDDANVFTVHLAHALQKVTHDYTVTRTINYVDANGTHLKPSTVQKLTFTRTGVQDLITKQITWNATPAQSFAAVNDLNILGYKTDTTSVPELTANWADQNSTVDVHYQVADSTVTVNFVDAMGHVIATTPVTGQVGSTVDLTAQVPDGWVAYNTDIPTRIVIGANPTSINYLIAHRVAFVKPTAGVKAGDLIPGTKTKTFNDKVNADNLVTHASYTINIWADEAHTRKLFTKTYHADFIRNALVDAITGDVYYYNWSEGGKHIFASFMWHAGNGYQAVVVPAWIATQADPTKTIDLVAQPQQASGMIQYQTTDGKVVSTQAFTGNNAVALTAPKGYTLMTDETIVMPTPDKNQTYVVYVRPTQTLYTAADKLPEGMESLNKTITRTILIMEANGHVRTITQRVRFTRTATVNADGKVTYVDWKATGRTVMSKVFLPKRRGYHNVVNGNLAKQNVTADMSDSVVNVEYVKD